jgi:2'-5' RNA ligase
MDDQALEDPFLPEELRLFIACELPQDWLSALEDASRTLAKSGLGALRWVRPEGMHLTLKFLGDAGRHLLPDLRAGLETACGGQTSFSLNLIGLGTFGGRRGVRVLWAGVEGNTKALQNLQRRVDDAVAELGFARDPRPYSPHLTLARVPESLPSDTGARITAALRQARLAETAPFTVSRTSLIRSQLGPGGARYTRLANADLGRA